MLEAYRSLRGPFLMVNAAIPLAICSLVPVFAAIHRIVTNSVTVHKVNRIFREELPPVTE